MNKAISIFAGVLIRWVLIVWLLYWVFQEQPGIATRIFVVLVTLGFEVTNLSVNVVNLKKIVK